ncbi:hypothetical protein FNV43_RR13209 [Rhamnella rubrinervis]|uniref:UDP-glucose iridoid glucosyltransferase-like n=1 Tax=Rhamnella rubrinervis TaxID=2594499 RepID=A0A8K0MEU2_9ROSA|nr:hypothetical protein FNV43_RR13209 [Rhamnella rubrinervis]
MRNETRRRRLVLFPCPYQGHINPMLQLGTILYSNGFSITIVHTNFNAPNPQGHPHFSFVSLPDGLSENDISTGDITRILTTINDNCKVCLQATLEKGQKLDDIICIIFDEHLYFCEAVAANIKLPSIILRTTSSATFLARYALLTLQAQGYEPFQDSISHEMVPKLHPLRFKDLPLPKSEDLKRAAQLVVDSYTIRSSSAVIWNTMDGLEQSCLMKIQEEYYCPVPIFPIGPMHKFASRTNNSTTASLLKEDSSCIAWLDKQSHNSVIYVSLGSIISTGEKEIAEMAWGLANSEQPFLWVIRPGSVSGSDWVELLPKGFRDGVGERGCIVKWAPQKEVLGHEAVGGFWSHCGWNSTLESISEGVPMICKPCFGDQRVNARYVCHEWRVGLELEKLERKDIERAIRKLILDDEGKDMRVRAKDLKEKVEVSTRQGGSSHKYLNGLVDFIMSF